MLVVPLVLASTSIYRRQLLERLGVPFTARAPRCDEEALRDPRLAPRALAEHLALAKAQSLTGDHPDAAIIGSDQLVALDGEVLGKPGAAERAVAQLERLQGRSHTLITAMVLCHRGQILRHTDVTTLTMRALARDELERYVAADAPLDCAGAYKIEARGIALFERIDTADHTAITGLPLMALTGWLRASGFALP